MMRRLLLVGLAALVIALALTGVLSILRVGEVVEVFPVPPETLDLPLPAVLAPEAALVSPQATVVSAWTPTSTAAGPLGPTVQPTTAVLQSGRDGYGGCNDTYIQFYRPTDNFCQSRELYVVTSNKAATLLQFDLTKLPENIIGLNSDATILEATLKLYSVQGNKGAMMGIYLPYGPWDPCTVTWNTPWEKPGADGLSDRESDPQVEGTVEQATGWMAFDVTDLVQYWLRKPAQNYGMIIKSCDVSVPSHHIFFSSDHPDEDVRPQLTIKYQSALATATDGSTPTHTATTMPISTSTGTPTAGPTLTPALAEAATPTLILPLSPRVVELHWQNEMDIGGSYPIQVIFRPEAAQAVSSSAKPYLLSIYGQVTAPTFDVVQNSPVEQVLEQPGDILTWSWQVRPKMVGSQLLSFDLLFSWRPATSAAPAIAVDSGTWYQTKVVRVVRPFRYWTHMTLLRNLLLSIGLVCLVGWHVLWRRTRGRSVGD